MEAETRLNQVDFDEHEHNDDIARSIVPRISDERLRAALHDFAGMVASTRGKPWEHEVWTNIAVRYFERFEHHGDDDLRYIPTEEAQHTLISSTLPTRVLVGGEGLEPPTSSV